MNFGYKASNEQFAPSELLRYGVLAEECGFDSVLVSDHLQPWRHDGGHAPFAMSWLGALGASTSTVLMGTSSGSLSLGQSRRRAPRRSCGLNADSTSIGS